MNATTLARNAYSTARTQTRTDRDTEYELIAKITHDIRTATEKGKTGFPALVSALHANRNLWVTLAADVAGADNQLPQQLRAQIFYLARFTDAHTVKVLNGSASPDALMEINTSVMRGLRSKMEVAQ
jgi:flagellar protein FlaF